MHVTNHALRSGNSAGQLMTDRMSRFILGNTDVSRLRHSEISRGVVKLGVSRLSIVRVNHMTSSATGRSVVARLIVRAEVIQSGIKQARLLQSEINGISSLRRAQSTRAQSLVRLAWIFITIGQTCFQSPLAPALKHPQHISRL